MTLGLTLLFFALLMHFSIFNNVSHYCTRIFILFYILTILYVLYVGDVLDILHSLWQNFRFICVNALSAVLSGHRRPR
jgi:hypothetical protein